jgi:MFS transporter, ACS family, D-galactonate transporter
MLTQWPGGYIGDRFGHRTVIVVSLVWAGLATIVSGLVSGLVIFIALRVFTGLGEGAFYSNDRSLITADTPLRKRGLGMGVAITGLAFGITIATIFSPNLISWGESVFGAEDAWRMTFVALGCVTLVVAAGIFVYFNRREPGLPYFRATLHMLRYAVVCLAAVMAVYWIGTSAGSRSCWRSGCSGSSSAARRTRSGPRSSRATCCSSTARCSRCCGTCGSSRSGRWPSWPTRRTRRSASRR